MSRFAVLAHDWPFPHLDLLLEHDGVLKAWRLPPDFTPFAPATAEAIGDHRLHYLDYEGPVAGGRGSVRRWDVGAMAWESVEDGRFVVVFAGERLTGRGELVRIEGTRWLLRPGTG